MPTTPGGPSQAEKVLARAVSERLEQVRRRIAGAGGDPAAIRVVAVTKGFGPEVARAALAAGLEDLGENYAQELLAKQPEVPGPCRWHFLGPIQRNKVRALAPHVALWQALDRPAAARAVAAHQPHGEVLLQVNFTGDGHKAGAAPGEAVSLLGAASDAGLQVRGLMTVGPAGDRDGARRCFAALAQLADRLGLEQRSMGMTDDLEEAVAEGATMLRLGRALFGPRPAQTRDVRSAADRSVRGASL